MISSYSFALAEKLLGVKMLIFGYNYTFYELKIFTNNSFNRIQINNVNIWTPRNLFKPEELLHIYSEIYIPFYSNPHAYELGGAKIFEGDIVIDAGACEGFFIDYALKKGAQKVIAIEPLKILADCLKKSYDINVQNKSVEILSYALSNTRGIDYIKTDCEYICEAKIDKNGRELCKTITIDDSVYICQLNSVDFIKMDIEGSEILAIMGAKKTIIKFKPKLSIAVYHGYENAKIIKELLEEYRNDYTIIFGGCYMYKKPYRPFILYAW